MAFNIKEEKNKDFPWVLATRMKGEELWSLSDAISVKKEKRELSEPERALARYDEAIKTDSNDAEAFFNRGRLLDELGNKEDALTDFNKAIEINPSFDEAFFHKALLLEDIDRKEEALESYNKVLMINPKDDGAFFNRGILLEEFDRLEEALESYNNAIKINPENTAAYNTRGNVLEDLGHNAAAGPYLCGDVEDRSDLRHADVPQHELSIFRPRTEHFLHDGLQLVHLRGANGRDRQRNGEE